MSNHTSTIDRLAIDSKITADFKGLRFTGRVIQAYEHQGGAFVRVTWDAAHGYPETSTGGHLVDDLLARLI